MSDSIQKKLGRVRPPRVQITYDVQIGDAIEKKEIPFVAGVIADLSGTTAGDEYSDRKFVEVDADSFNKVMKSIGPNLTFNVERAAEDPAGDDDPAQREVVINFAEMNDFGPDNIVLNVPFLETLFHERRSLADLLLKLDGNRTLPDELATMANANGATEDN